MKRFLSKSQAAFKLVTAIAQNGDTPFPLPAMKDMSTSYMEQLAAKLKKAGIVRSFRGPGGGYVLNKPANDITLQDIILVADPTASDFGTSPEGAAFAELMNITIANAAKFTVQDMLDNSKAA